MINLLKTYQKRLTNLTSGNRSLLLLKPFRRQFFDLYSLDFVDGNPAFQYVDQVLNAQNKIKLCPNIDPRDGKSNALAQDLKLLSKTNETLKNERGAEDLYLGYPFVEGKLLDGTLVRCPLAFFPYELRLENNHWFLVRKDNPAFLNRSFLLAFAYFNKVTIEDELIEKSLDELGTGHQAFLTELYELLKESKVVLNFNSELFQTKIEAFPHKKKKDFDETAIGELKLFPQAVLGIFPQAGSYISSDYSELIQNGFSEKYQDLEAYLDKHQVPSRDIKEENLRLPLPVDASQEDAIRQIKAGKSMVIQGPPGTGKSQMICNLMADYAAEGKRVLLVCQKRAAIDTVYTRLSEVGMQSFLALVHDFKSDRRGLYDLLHRQIEGILAYKHENQSLNAIFLEREFDAVCRKIDKVVEELEIFKSALFDDSTFGKPIKELYLLCKGVKEKTLNLDQQYSFFHFDTLGSFLQDLETLERYRDHLENGTEEARFWTKRKDFSTHTLNELKDLKTSLYSITEVKTQAEALHSPFTLEVEKELELIELYQKLISDDKMFALLKFAAQDPENLNQKRNLANQIEQISLKEAILAIDQPEEALEQVETAWNKNNSLLGSISWKLLSKEKKQIYHLLHTLGLPEDEDQLEPLQLDLKQVIALRDIARSIGMKQEKPTITEVRDELNAQIAVAMLWADIDTHCDFFKEPLVSNTKPGFDQWIQNRKSCIDFIREHHAHWLQLFSFQQIEEIESRNLDQINQYLDTEFDNIQARDALFKSLSDVQKYCYRETTAHYESQFARNFEQNLMLYMIDDLESKNPKLRQVSSLQLEILEKELQELIMKKRKFSTDHLLLKLREHTYKNIEKNRLGNPTTYRELKHQVSKKRQIWPVRKLIEEFDHELFDLLPCWMASPETVSAIFPLKKEPIFDLVVFDEASQCFSENGLTAMLRGKQVVIVGDKQQLQPNDLYRIRFEEEKDEEVLLEVESLLDLASQFLPQTILKGHYRSKSIDLIDFANKTFYNNQLKLLPDFKELNDGEPAIEYIEVDGVWEKQVNRKEAQRVQELVRLFKSAGNHKSIGIVTFNFHQAEYISELLEESPNVTIKNIENIQGDEFDLVIFSVGYAPDSSGKMKLNFGSLSQKGGENRLNVAITRARERVIVVCSISPDKLNTENSANEGPKMLKAYLQYAQKVAAKDFVPTPASVLPNNWSMQLKNDILAENQSLTTELPFADLAEKNGQQYGRLLFTDDDHFYSAQSVKESFAYSPLILKQKGWELERAWSRNWWQQVKRPSLLSEGTAKTK
ncbi:AAA family ATPase [Marinilongibacter aquaticus]|uniref:DEAD/DEAH box helicase n=1 Tax=Marinilongibacter aquaticus TaxID=2975157 RepID=UPI0021BD8061|nr:AAA domain-containing protein [Marinilongibacter aquaticus]UBM57989.1 AAA family ATPase [Marinilongibacter aquaticus]